MLNRFNFKKVISGGLLPLMGLGLFSFFTIKPVEANQKTSVSAELMLSVDISGSVNSSEYDLQMDGYAEALRDPDVINAIKALPKGLAVSLQFWAKFPAPPMAWRVLKTEAEIRAFADELDNMPRPNKKQTYGVAPWTDKKIGGSTGIARGLTAATTSILNNQYEGDVLIIDISGDGKENVQSHSKIRDARDNAVANDITVNGLPIDPSNAQNIVKHYNNNVVGGEDAFAEVSNGFSDFTRAVKTKLEREIINAKPGTGCPTTPDTITLGGIIRDFDASHPDFNFANRTTGLDVGIVTTTLGLDGKPVFANNNNFTTTTKENFDQWYRNVPGVNQSMPFSIALQRVNSASTMFRYENTSFFPVDGKLGNEQYSNGKGGTHNYHFTYEIRTQFTYKGDGTETLTFSGDDDVWVYIDGQRVIDIGGVHSSLTRSVNVSTLGLVAGETYDFHFFFAERNPTGSNFILETNLDLHCDSDSDGVPDLEDPTPNTYNAPD